MLDSLWTCKYVEHVSCWIGQLWRALESEDPQKLSLYVLLCWVEGMFHAGIGKLAFTKFFVRPIVWFEGVVAEFCHPLIWRGGSRILSPSTELGAGYSSLELLHFVCESIPSASSSIPLLRRPAQVHVETYILYITAAVSLKMQLPSNHLAVVLHWNRKWRKQLWMMCALIVFCSVVQNYIIFGLFKMLLQSYSIKLLGLP